MKFLSLDITNFMSVSHMTINFDTTGLTLIEGINNDAQVSTSNGSGKTSIFDAMQWVLFGCRSKSVPKDEIVNDLIGKNCSVTVIFLLNNHKYIVVRYRLDTNHHNKLTIDCDGEDLSGSTPRKSQLILDDILPFDEPIFSNIIYFPSGMHNSYMHMSDNEKKLLLESLLDVSAYEKCLLISKENIIALKTEISLLNREYEYKTTSSNKYKVRHDKMVMDNNLVVQKKELSSLMDRRLILMKSMLENNKKSEILTSYINPVNDYNRNASTINDLLSRMVSSMDDYITNNTKKCCTGLEHNSEPHSHPERSPVSVLHSLRKECSSISILSHQKLFLSQRIKSRLKTDLNDYSKTSIYRKRELVDITSSSTTINRYIDSYSSLLLNSKLDLDTALEDSKLSKKKLDMALDEEIYLVYIRNAFITMRSNMLSHSILDLNKFIKVYIDSIFSENVSINVIPYKENSSSGIPRISISISFGEQKPRDYYTFSEGERKRIDLSLHMALIDLSKKYSNQSCNLLLLDEATEAIDQNGTIAVIDIIKNHFKDKSVYMISHQPFIASEIQNKLTVIKENGFSTILN